MCTMLQVSYDTTLISLYLLASPAEKSILTGGNEGVLRSTLGFLGSDCGNGGRSKGELDAD